MSLTAPSVGELLDRFSILRLKIHHGALAGKPVDHFEQERREILDRLPHGLNFENPLFEQLSFVNECLWELTDAMREATGVKVIPLQARYGSIILRFNDKRARLIAEISAQHGDHRVEKIS